MKKLFTTLALVGAAAFTANAQKTTIVKGIWMEPMAPGGFDVPCTDSFQVSYGFVNLGPGTIEPTDTFGFNDFESETSTAGWIWYVTEPVAPGDTFSIQTWNSHYNRIGWLVDTALGEAVVAPFAPGVYLAAAQFFGFYTQGAEGWEPRTDITFADTTDDVFSYSATYFNMPDCSGTSIFKNTQNELSVNVYPNPVSDKLNVTVSLAKAGAASLRVVDITGREVMNQMYAALGAGAQKLSLDVNHLPNGLYTVEILANDQRGVTKFTIKK